MHIVREGEELDELAGEVQEIEDATETLMNALSQLPPELELEGLYSFLYLMSGTFLLGIKSIICFCPRTFKTWYT